MMLSLLFVLVLLCCCDDANAVVGDGIALYGAGVVACVMTLLLFWLRVMVVLLYVML